MEMKTILPLAIGGGVVLALIAKNGGGGSSAPTVVNLNPTAPDPSVQTSIQEAGETARTKLQTMGALAAATFGYLGTAETAHSQNRIASLAAYRDVSVAGIEGATTRFVADQDTRKAIGVSSVEASRDVSISGAETARDIAVGQQTAQRDMVASYYDNQSVQSQTMADIKKTAIETHGSVATAQISAGRDLGISTLAKDRDVLMEREATRQEEIRANANVSTANVQGRTQQAVAETERKQGRDSSIIEGVASVAGGIIGSLINPGGGTIVGGSIGRWFGGLF